jgi:endoglucanase
MDTDGNWNGGSVPPLPSDGVDGPGQMNHFTSQYGLNVYRLPVTWQYLVNNNPGGSLDGNNFGKYNQLVQACLSTGAYCVIDIHNYARWNGKVIGQGGPSNDQFASLWSQM